jgi:hypothetical protein
MRAARLTRFEEDRTTVKRDRGGFVPMWMTSGDQYTRPMPAEAVRQVGDHEGNRETVLPGDLILPAAGTS